MADFLSIVKVILWGTVGAAITPLVFRQKGRDPRWGALFGAAAGALGNIWLLLPLWALISRPRKVCPECENLVHADAITCPHCDTELPPSPPTRDLPLYPGWLAQMGWGWLAASALVMGLALAPLGLGGLRLDRPTVEVGGEIRRPNLGVRPTAGPGIGLTRGHFEGRFKVKGFTFEAYTDANGLSGVLGRKDAEQTWIYVMGPDDSLQTVALGFARADDLPAEVKDAQDANLQLMLELVMRDTQDVGAAQGWIESQVQAPGAHESETTIGRWRVYLWAEPDRDWTGVGIELAE